MLRLTTNGLVKGPVAGIEDEELASLVEGQVAALEEAFTAFRRELRKIEESVELTDEGKTVRRAQLVEDWRPRLRNALNLDAIERLGKQIEATRTNMHLRSNRLDLDQLDVDEEEAREMVRETRRLLRQKLQEQGGALEVERIAGKAAAEDDVITLRAVELAPPQFPLLSEERLAPIRERHSEVHFPDHVAELQEKARALGRLQHNALQAREQVEELTGEDPVSTPDFHVLTADHTLEPWEPEPETAEPEGESEPEAEPAPVA